ncbi:response regulator transcription factor [Sphingobium lignivorans]|uniref:DNA-binding response OmpR family regulator n=1 Tax=Sphingobium lignivorans TaxID=2735886 RepID=A0ABR6NDU0_9SPHN|nr:response regulator [Sphingobium lignivorans]MBB5985439.1 DNA-binding response OmpR family regulator [Sphingobium lignivorans]
MSYLAQIDSETGAAQPPVVLVVDDVADNRVIVCRHLARMGFRPESADSARSGLAAIYASRPDIVLLDYMMPDLTGLAVLRELRANALYADLPVIMLTARTEATTIVDVLEAGANDYVPKPIDFIALRARIEKQLEAARASRAVRTDYASLDRRQSTSVLEKRELKDQLTREVAQRMRLEEQLASLGATVNTADGRVIDRAKIVHCLRRVEHLLSRLASQEGPINPAVIMEAAAQVRTGLKELRADD